MGIIFPYIKILRPLNLFFSALTVIITAYLCDSVHDFTALFNAIIVVVTFAGASNILNDILDITIDQKNQPNRPIPKGKISQKKAFYYMLFLYSVGIYTVLALPKLAIAIAIIIVLPILVFYTSYLKRIPLLGNMAIALVLGLVFLFSEAALLGTIKKMWTPAWLALDHRAYGSPSTDRYLQSGMAPAHRP